MPLSGLFAGLSLQAILLAIILGVVAFVVVEVVKSLLAPAKPISAEYKPRMVGDITLDELTKYDGRDPYRQLLFAVRGKIYDVTEARAFYGPGGGYHVFCGKEVARALAKMAISEDECSDRLEDLSERELRTLGEWEEKFRDKYTVVGQVVPPLELTEEQLRAYDGSDSSKPILLSLRGTIYDVTPGKQFYGPDGVYPFAGHETARAFAKFSTEPEDLSGDLKGCTAVELDQLREWEAKLYWKYSIVGRLVQEGSEGASSRAGSAAAAAAGKAAASAAAAGEPAGPEETGAAEAKKDQ